MKHTHRRFVLAAALALAALAGGGCAAGSATAGYSAKAGTADDLGSATRAAIVADAVAQSRAYTDAQMAALRAEMARR